MAKASEVFTDVSLRVPGQKVPVGSFDETEKRFYELASLPKLTDGKYDKQIITANHHSLDQLYKNDCSPAEPVEVDYTVMMYIYDKYPQELDNIRGKDVQMSSVKNTMFFYSKQTVLAHFARQRFITFYQKIATDLQVKQIECTASQMRLLESEFPDLLISPCTNKRFVDVTGGYVSMERLELFLKNDFKSPWRTIGHIGPKPSVPPVTEDPKKDEDETCPICMDTLTEKKTLPNCKHTFCNDCLKRAFEFKPACPICGVLYGELKGNQPDNGSMRVSQEVTSHLPGYEKYGTLVINYYIPSGTQGNEHPNPGQSYEGAARTAYLPDSSEGRKVLRLLQRAFDQRLIFTVGHSSTSGRNNVVTWNDIHHKTSRTGGPSHYGYPDPEYLFRVQEELKVKGIC